MKKKRGGRVLGNECIYPLPRTVYTSSRYLLSFSLCLLHVHVSMYRRTNASCLLKLTVYRKKKESEVVVPLNTSILTRSLAAVVWRSILRAGSHSKRRPDRPNNLSTFPNFLDLNPQSKSRGEKIQRKKRSKKNSDRKSNNSNSFALS